MQDQKLPTETILFHSITSGNKRKNRISGITRIPSQDLQYKSELKEGKKRIQDQKLPNEKLVIHSNM